MLRVSLLSQIGACLLLLVLMRPVLSDDELDPAFQQSQPDGPLAIVPENDQREEWSTRDIDDVAGYLDAHPYRFETSSNSCRQNFAFRGEEQTVRSFQGPTSPWTWNIISR